MWFGDIKASVFHALPACDTLESDFSSSYRWTFAVHFICTFQKQYDLQSIWFFYWKMLGGNNNDAVLPFFLDENRLQYPANATNQLQLFGNCEFPVQSVRISESWTLQVVSGDCICPFVTLNADVGFLLAFKLVVYLRCIYVFVLVCYYHIRACILLTFYLLWILLFCSNRSCLLLLVLDHRNFLSLDHLRVASSSANRCRWICYLVDYSFTMCSACSSWLLLD